MGGEDRTVPAMRSDPMRAQPSQLVPISSMHLLCRCPKLPAVYDSDAQLCQWWLPASTKTARSCWAAPVVPWLNIRCLWSQDKAHRMSNSNQPTAAAAALLTPAVASAASSSALHKPSSIRWLMRITCIRHCSTLQYRLSAAVHAEPTCTAQHMCGHQHLLPSTHAPLRALSCPSAQPGASNTITALPLSPDRRVKRCRRLPLELRGFPVATS